MGKSVYLGIRLEMGHFGNRGGADPRNSAVLFGNSNGFLLFPFVYQLVSIIILAQKLHNMLPRCLPSTQGPWLDKSHPGMCLHCII